VETHEERPPKLLEARRKFTVIDDTEEYEVLVDPSLRDSRRAKNQS
jgi:hypothetical protein